MNGFLLRFVLLASSAAGSLAWPNAELNSREYKAMLQASLFASPSEEQRVDTVMAVLEELQKDLTVVAAAANAVDTQGEFELKEDTPRLVRYFDTPGSCLLRHNGLTMRLRRPLDEWSNDPWEAMLKARSGDRYHSTVRMPYVEGCNTDVSQDYKNKFEEDLGHFDWTGSVYSFSQKCYFGMKDLPKHSRGNLKTVSTVWENTKDLFQKDLGFDDTVMATPLALVSNTTITEVAYEDFWVYLDDDDYGDDEAIAQAKVTLWYKTQDGIRADSGDHEMIDYTGVGDPIVAELSFRIKSEHEEWSDDTIVNMHNFWEQLGKSLSKKWLDAESMSKTSWIYQYDHDFCHPKDSDGDESS
ncbi:expressed unknown protein [Seminavis robusta]|uniref:Uncharacterized protein n=1 Tax=Seminavis robusta TaxID=568900 RepID=A0A9N8EM58_9STRA|nr:expressed unknown protein [Seminavis robusta]|eukprot:Sro1197_g251560.1 n/a (356) ;mRNA; f:27205-28272